MNLRSAIRSCFGQYVGFNGRARRSELWYFALFTSLPGPNRFGQDPLLA
jgi:hypothetical protein